MAELNRKRKLSDEENSPDIVENASKKQNITQNDAENTNGEHEEKTNLNTISQADETQSSSKSFSRLMARNVVGTIGRKTSLFTRRTLRSRRRSLQNLNQTNNWNDTQANATSSDGELGVRNKNQTLRKFYTLKLSKIKDKFKTRRQLRKERFRSMHSIVENRSQQESNQSKVAGNRQDKFLEKLLEKHNKYLENL